MEKKYLRDIYLKSSKNEKNMYQIYIISKRKNKKSASYKAKLNAINNEKLPIAFRILPRYVKFTIKDGIEKKENPELKISNDYILTGKLLEFTTERNYKGFNKEIFEYGKSVYFEISDIEKISKKDKSDKSNIKKMLRNLNIYKLKEYIYSLSNKFIKDSSLFKALVFGDTSDVLEKVKEEFKMLNIYHMLAVSGAHVTYLVIVFDFLFKKIQKKKIKIIFLNCLLFIFMFLADVTSSVTRACLMIILQNIFEFKNSNFNFWYSLIFTYFILIILNPFRIMDIGLYLSYFGSAGIILFNSILKEFSIKNYLEEKIKSKICRNVFIYIIENIFVSISVQFLIFPILLNSFNKMNLNFLFSSFLLSLPLAYSIIFGIVFMIISILLFLLNILKIDFSIFYLLLFLVGKIDQIFIFISLKIIHILKKIMVLNFDMFDMNIFFVISYYLFLIIFFKNILRIINKRKRKKEKEKEKRRN